MKNSFKTHIGRTLDIFGLRGVARSLEASLRPKTFRADSPETPVAVERALELARESGNANQGDYLEFGLFRGYTLWYAQKVTREAGNETMRFVGFDSFEGFPEIQGVDQYKGDFGKGMFRTGLKYVRHQYDKHGVDWNRVILVPGFFEDSLTDELKGQKSLKCAAVVLIDCVLYSSTKLALEFLRDLVIDGTIILFDDWNAFDQQEDHGERRAFAEFLSDTPQLKASEIFDYGVYGKAFQLAWQSTALKNDENLE